MEDISDRFIRKELDETLYEVTLYDGDNEVFRDGFGRLVSDDSGQTNIIVFVRFAGGLPWGRYAPTGQLRIEGLVHSGWLLQSQVSAASRNRLHAKTMLMEWSIRCPEVRLVSGHPNKIPGCALRAFVDSVSEPIYLKGSEFEESGFDSRKGVSTDWLELNTKQGAHFALKKGDDTASILKASAPCDEEGLRRMTEAFLDALSLCVGRRIRLLTTSMLYADNEVCILFPAHSERRRSHGSFPLIPLDFGSPPAFVRLATEFLIDNPDNKIMAYVGLFYDSLLESFQSMCLHVTTAVEGVQDIVLSDPNHKVAIKDSDKASRQRLKRFRELRQKIVNDLCTFAEHAGDDELLSRLSEEISHVKMDSPRDLVLLAAELSECRIRYEEAENWRLLRNSAAHGAELDSTDGVNWLRFFDSLAIMYRLICAILGWNGSMREYGGTVLRELEERARQRAELRRKLRQEEVALVAHGLFAQRNFVHGHDVEDWRDAEDILIEEKIKTEEIRKQLSVDDIRREAYLLSTSSNGGGDDAVSDWLKAEQALIRIKREERRTSTNTGIPNPDKEPPDRDT